MYNFLKVNNKYINLHKVNSIIENDSNNSIKFVLDSSTSEIHFPDEETYEKAKQKLNDKFNKDE